MLPIKPSSSSNTVERQNMLKRDLREIHVVVTSAMMPFIVIFNSLLISTVCIFRRLHRTNHYLVVSIACFDLLYGVVTIPLYILSYSEVTTFTRNKYGCIGMYSLILMVTIGRCLVLQWLVLDRYIAIMNPFWYQRHVSHGHVFKYTIGFISTFLILIGVMPMLGVNEYSEGGDCSFYTIWPDWYEVVFFNSMTGLTALIPSVLNSILFRTVKKLRKVFEKDENKTPSQPALRHRLKTSIRVSMSLHFTFLIFYMPTFCSVLLRIIDQQEGTEADHLIIFDYVTLTWEYGFMGVINPILMFCLKTKYHKALAKMIKTPCCLWHELKHDRLGSEFGTDFKFSLKASICEGISPSKPICDSDNGIANVQSPTSSGVSTTDRLLIQLINSPKGQPHDTLGTFSVKTTRSRSSGKSDGSNGSWWSPYIERARYNIKKAVSFKVEEDVQPSKVQSRPDVAEAENACIPGQKDSETRH